MRSFRALLGCLLIVSGACLVTDEVEYGAPNVPAHIVPVAPVGFTRVPQVPNPDCPGSGRSDTRPWMAFRVQITDPNANDNLEVRVLVNGRGLLDRYRAGRPSQLSDITICLSRQELSEACNLVEVLVSRRFKVTSLTEPESDGDLAREDWTILGPADEFADAVPEDCAENEREDAGI